jgi:hypothetical protein
LRFKEKDELFTVMKPLHTTKQVDDAERLVRVKLEAGFYDATSTFLTRWNPTKRQVETVIGAPDLMTEHDRLSLPYSASWRN